MGNCPRPPSHAFWPRVAEDGLGRRRYSPDAYDAARIEAERLHGALAKSPFLVTDNGSSFLARSFRRHIDGDYAHVRIGYADIHVDG